MSADKNKDECELAIKKTLAYRSIFKFPLSLYQLKTFLVSEHEFNNKIIEESVEHLVNKGFIREKNHEYFLPGISVVDWEERKKFSKKLIRRNEKVLKLIGRIPWIKMIAITGSVAAGNPSDKSDIDVFIISAKGRVWLVRLFSTLLLKILNKFPRTDGEKGKICTNLFIDERALVWSKEKRNLFIAHDIVLMQPIVDKNNTYLRFLNANIWVSDFFPNFPINKISTVVKKSLFSSPLIDFVEKIAMHAQIKHMKRKQTTEITTKSVIHFNKNDNCPKILEIYEKVLINRIIS